jgi:hypothetical protein
VKPVFQTKRGIGGNCLAACLATIFEVPLESMPDLAPPETFNDWSVQPKLMRKWLAAYGYDYLEIDLEKQQYHWTDKMTPEGLCLFSVLSPSPELRAKGYGHFLVGKVEQFGDEIQYRIVHDPLGPITEETSKYKVTAAGFFIRSGAFTITTAELSALRADRESLMLDRAQLLQRIEELELQIATATAAQADLWLVWSNEHGAWWGPNESGYYTDIRSAGRYTKEKAMECADSRSHTKGKLPPEVIISERDAMEGKNPTTAQAGKENKQS